MKQIKRFFKWIKYLLYTLPVGDPKTIHASDVVNGYTIVVYNGAKINLKITELPMFDALSRKDKRAMADKFKSMERKGLIRYEEINGKLTCIRNKDYQAIADKT
jgi:hypothetical protein